MKKTVHYIVHGAASEKYSADFNVCTMLYHSLGVEIISDEM